jgi:hypothetical protein
MPFSVLSFVLSRQFAAKEGIASSSRQNFYGLLGGLLGSNPVGLGVTVALANQEASQIPVIPPPSLSAIDPSSAAPGATQTVTLTGSNFLVGASVNVRNTLVSVSNINVLSDTKMTALFTIDPTASGSVDVSVTTDSGFSESLQFAIASTSSPPNITSVSPATGIAGSPGINVTLTGSGFVPGPATSASQLTASDPAITITQVNVASATQLTAVLNIGASASIGSATLTVTNPGGATATIPFTVFGLPTLTSITPTNAVQGTTVPVNLIGTNFVPGTTNVNSQTSDVTVSNVVTGSGSASTTFIAATFTIKDSAQTGTVNISVSTPGGATAPIPFTITKSASSSAPEMAKSKASSSP